MILKNLFRRKARTALTILGVGVGIATIIILGALANGIEVGYQNMFTSTADLVLTQPSMWDVTLSSLDESIGDDLVVMPEVDAVSPMLMGNVMTQGAPYFFVYGYPEDSFALDRFNVIRGVRLDDPEARRTHGTPLLLGASASEALHRDVGDTLHLGESAFRVVGVYETGDALEDGGAVIGLYEAQTLLGKTHQVSVFYIQLESPDGRTRLTERVARRWPDLLLTTSEQFASSLQEVELLRQMAWAIAGLAIVIGGVGMMNAQLMAVFERTREIGVLRALGWSRLRVLGMILGETLVVCLVGGLAGIGLGYLGLAGLSGALAAFGTSTASVGPTLLLQSIVTVLILGLVGGLLPAWRAAQLQPVEALRYEGGGAGAVGRLPIHSMAAQSLWRRKTRTLLTLGAIGLTVGAVVMMDVFTQGAISVFTRVFTDAGAEVVVRQAGVSDTGYSALDERIGDRIAALPEVAHVSSMQMAVMTGPDLAFFFALGYGPNDFALRRYTLVEGERLTGNREIMLGRAAAESLHRGVGDMVTFGDNRYRVVGIFEVGGFEDTGGIISLRDAQNLMGQPRKVQLYLVGLRDPAQAEAVVDYINTNIPEAYAAPSAEFTENMPDMQTMNGMTVAIIFLATLAGGVGVMNTMLMAVLERTREIGVLRALGWRRRRILGMILQEALLLGFLGSFVGILTGWALIESLAFSPFWSIMLTIVVWTPGIFIRALMMAVGLGVIGGLYPAFRATRMPPVEALRYE